MQLLTAIINVPAIKLPDGTMSKTQVIDLTERQGQIVRIYVDARGGVEINPKKDCYWQVFAMTLPAAQFITVQQGTRTHTSAVERTVVRGSKRTDTIKLAANESVGRVGFAWAAYKTPDDFSLLDSAITWNASRGPTTGDSYNIEIITTTTEPDMIDQPLPLDLADITVTAFPAPK